MQISKLRVAALLSVAAIVPGVASAGISSGTPALSVSKSLPQTGVLPAALRLTLYQTLAKNAGPAYRVNKNGCAVLSRSALQACFNVRGAHFSGTDVAPLGLHLFGYGRGTALSSVKEVQPEINGNRVNYVHGALNEWWHVLPMGFEQGFTLNKRPGGQGALTLVLAANDQATPRRKDTLGWGRLRYGQLAVTDARGKILPASLKTKGDHILIAVNDSHAAYPITVDPLVWLEQKVTASDGAAGDNFGWSVAISGQNAVVGAKHASVNGNIWQGAAYVFNESNGVWSETQKLTANDGVADDRLGNSVAISGPVIVVGTPDATVKGNAFQGAAYVFTQSDDGTWVQSAKLTANDGAAQDQFGEVAVSGSTILVGAELAAGGGNAAEGAAYVFTGSGSSWTQVQKLTPDDGVAQDYFGASVAISGSSAIVGATQEGRNGPGAAYVFENSNGTWSQTGKLTDSNGEAGDVFGLSVDISGTTAVVGAPFVTVDGDPQQGVADVFSNSGGTWTQTQQLFDSDGGQYRGENFGWGVALSGSTMLVGSYYAQTAFEYTESGGTWTLAQKLSPSDAQEDEVFGPTVAISGEYAFVGAQIDTVNGNEGQGAAYFYGESNLGLNMSAPQTVGQGQTYVSQTIATNNASAASPAVSATITVPAAVSFVSASATQGSCSEASGVVTCDFGQIDGNAGTATADVTLKATGSPGNTINNTTSVALAQPALTASAPTQITSSQSCPAGYTSYSGTLAPNERASSPGYAAPKGIENGILISPPGFRLFMLVKVPGLAPQLIGSDSSNEIHHQAPAGNYKWIAQAWSQGQGGDYTLCVQHP